MILDQRSDIEMFFLESMEQIKEEKKRKLESERKAQQMQNNQQMYNQDGVMSYLNKENENQPEQITVELQDLDLEDRERILRLLFSKMNTGESASSWRDKPEGSQRAGSSHMATAQLNQSFREQEDEEEDYDQQDDQDANLFDQTKIPDHQYSQN